MLRGRPGYNHLNNVHDACRDDDHYPANQHDNIKHFIDYKFHNFLHNNLFVNLHHHHNPATDDDKLYVYDDFTWHIHDHFGPHNHDQLGPDDHHHGSDDDILNDYYEYLAARAEV